MVTSIKLKGMYNIGVNSSNQIDVAGTNVALKDIPFVRYDFESYGDDEVNYITRMMNQFKLSTHLIQIKVNENIVSALSKLDVFDGKVAKYLYINVDTTVLNNGCIDNETLRLTMNAISTTMIDRIMLVDNTDNMDMLNAKKIMTATAKVLTVKPDKIGICSSPLCMTGELACLTALKARELASIYSSNTDVALPSANHQCMNCCGCMRFFDITSNVAAPAESKKGKSQGNIKSDGTSSEKSGSTSKKQKEHKSFSISNYV